MSFQSILNEIDAQIGTLQQARSLISESQDIQIPEGRVHVAPPTMPFPTTTKNRKYLGMSEEARKRIGDATRKRWADKRAAAKKTSTKKSTQD